MQTEPTTDNQPLDAERLELPRVRLGSSSAYQLAAQVLTLGTSFVASVLIARSLGPAGKGQLSVLQQVPGTLMVLLNLGLAGANAYFVGTGKTKVGVAVGNSIAFAAVAGLVGLPIVWAMTAGPLSVVDGLSTSAAAIAWLSLPLGLASSYLASIGIGLGKIREISVAQVLGAIISVAAIVTAFALGQLGLVTAMLATLLAVVMGLGLNLRTVLAGVSEIRTSIDALRSSARYSLKSYASNLAGYLNYRQDILLVGYIAGAKAVGIYSIAVTFAELMWYVPNSIASSILAKSMQEDAAEGVAFTTRSARLTLAVMLAVSVAAGLLLRPLVSFFYTEQFLPAYLPFMILLPGSWAMGVGKILAGYMGGHGRLYPRVSVIAAVLNLLGNLLLIPYLGYNGAALASAVSYAYAGTHLLILFMRETGAPARSVLIPTREDWAATGAALRQYAAAVAHRFARSEDR